MAYVPLRKAVETLGMHPNTLRKYADNGKISSIKNEAGQRLYDCESYIHGAVEPELICYCRVSSHKQRDDLERQVQYMQGEYPGATVVKDIGSGLNFKRKGLRTLLDKLMRGSKLTLVVFECNPWCFDDEENKDDAFIIRHLVEFNGGEIIVLCLGSLLSKEAK